MNIKKVFLSIIRKCPFIKNQVCFNHFVFDKGIAIRGLTLSLKGQGRTIDAYWVEREAKTALLFSTVDLDMILPFPAKLGQKVEGGR